MKRRFLTLALLAAIALPCSAQGNISRESGQKIQASFWGDRGIGIGLTGGVTWLRGNGLSFSAGAGGEWNQRPNSDGNVFLLAFGEAKYSLLKGSVSPFVAARFQPRFLIPSHLKEGSVVNFYRVSGQTDLFGYGIAGLDFNRFALWGGIGGGPSLFTEESKDEALKVVSKHSVFMDMGFLFGLSYWF